MLAIKEQYLMGTIEKNTEIASGNTAGGVLAPSRSRADIDNLYRFIYENDLRRDAQLIFSEIIKVMKPKKSKRGRKRGRKPKTQ